MISFLCPFHPEFLKICYKKRHTGHKKQRREWHLLENERL